MCRPARLAVLLAFACAVPAASARSYPPAMPAGVVAEIVAVRGDTVIVRVKSSKRARLYSLVPTAAGYAVIAVALLGSRGGREPSPIGDDVLGSAGLLVLVGPSVGHFYAGQPKTAFTGIAVRYGGLAISSVGALAYSLRGLDDLFDFEDDGDDERGSLIVADALIVAGLLVFARSTVYDIMKAPRSARRTNERAARKRTQVLLSPVVAPRQGVGAHLAVRF